MDSRLEIREIRAFELAPLVGPIWTDDRDDSGISVELGDVIQEDIAELLPGGLRVDDRESDVLSLSDGLLWLTEAIRASAGRKLLRTLELVATDELCVLHD